MLNKHFPDVFRRDSRVYRFLRVLEKFCCAVAEGWAVLLRLFDHLAQSVQDLWQIRLELRYRLAEIGNLRPFISKEQVKQVWQFVSVVNRRADDFIAVLKKNGGLAVLENNIVARIAATKL